MACECLVVRYSKIGFTPIVELPLVNLGELNGVDYFSFTVDGVTWYLFYYNGAYYVDTDLTSVGASIFSKDTLPPCPIIGSTNNGNYLIQDANVTFDYFEIKQGNCSGCCIKVILNGINIFEALPNGATVNGAQVYQFFDGLFGYYIFQYDSESQNWVLYPTNVNGEIIGGAIATLFEAPPTCPIGNSWVILDPETSPFTSVLTKDCITPKKCVTISYSLPESEEINIVDVAIYDFIDDKPIYVFTLPEYPTLTFKILYADYGAPFFAGWYLITLGGASEVISFLETDGTTLDFPFSDLLGSFGWSQSTLFNILNTSEAKSCPVEVLDCGCGMKFTFILDGVEQETIIVDSNVFYNERLYYTLPATDYAPALFVFWNGYAWVIADSFESQPVAQLYGNFTCPIGIPIEGDPESLIGYWEFLGDSLTLKSEGVSCTTCGIEDRIFKQYESVKLPSEPSKEKRGFIDCCNCKYKVLGSLDGDSYKNDISSFWIKLNETGSATFKLLKNGVNANYNLEPKTLVNDPNTVYVTINWGDVLASDGVGCFNVVLEYNIGGIVGTIDKGTFTLDVYSIANALHTARVKAVFNLYHESEGIDFTGSNVVSTLRFEGFIGNRQSNTEIDNLIYQSRESKSVIRENLNKYEILTDPLESCFISPLIDLYLLSENELYISDYNAHNHSYDIKDLPVILEEGPKVEYKEFSRKATLTAVVGDKFKNKRTYFK